MCNDRIVHAIDRPNGTPTDEWILDVATEVLGADPDAGIGDIAAAAGVVRRTVYGYFSTRSALVLALTRRAVGEMLDVMRAVATPDRPADAVWVDVIARIWPLVHRYRVLVVLRRGAFGPEIHALLAPVDEALADLVRRGQADQVFGTHLPAEVLAQVSWSAVFAIADHDLTRHDLGVRGATTSSLLLLGVPEHRAAELLDG